VTNSDESLRKEKNMKPSLKYIFAAYAALIAAYMLAGKAQASSHLDGGAACESADWCLMSQLD
jgi:hypothetical protein